MGCWPSSHDLAQQGDAIRVHERQHGAICHDGAPERFE